MDRSEVAQLDQTNPYSLLQRGPEDIEGQSNYLVNIYSSVNKFKAKVNLFMVDSNRELCKENNHGWGCVSDSQADWLEKTAAEQEKLYGKTMKLAF